MQQPPDDSEDVGRVKRGEVFEGRTFGMELVWRCADCGYQLLRMEALPDRCPDCAAPKEHFVAITED